MRRKSDMFKDFERDSTPFLPAEGDQQAATAAAETRERLATVEEQLKSQYTSIAAYARIAQEAVETARAEARADLDREKATLVGLVERVREESLGNAADSPTDASTLDRLAALEHKFEQLNEQFAQVLKSQEELANSIAFVFEHQMRNSGWAASCASA